MENDTEIDMEIYDTDNELWMDDEYNSSKIAVSPSDKTYTHRASMHDDVYYRTETSKYKIETDPIRVSVKLIERYDEPPKEYMVKDGVVLESDILKKSKFVSKGLIKDLKEQIEWHEYPIYGGLPIVPFILSRHPDIVSKEEYKRHLRQNVERIKLGIEKVKEYLKVNTEKGLEVVVNVRHNTNDIWTPESKTLEEDEQQKQLDYIEQTLQPLLFDKDSENFVGISYNEFYSGDSLINKLEFFLEEENFKKNEDEATVETAKTDYKWFIVGALAVVALTSSVWTAIGVFILGAIIISLINK